ncbi:hypothetical protein GCM10023222_12940 [Saccharopolyspora cebuensis]
MNLKQARDSLTACDSANTAPPSSTARTAPACEKPRSRHGRAHPDRRREQAAEIGSDVAPKVLADRAGHRPGPRTGAPHRVPRSTNRTAAITARSPRGRCAAPPARERSGANPR